MDVALRRAVEADTPALVELLRQLGWELTAEQVTTGLAVPGTDVTVAELEDEVVGLISVTTRRHFFRGGDAATIDAIVVDERHRSLGIGEILVNHAIDAAIRHGAQAVEVVSSVRRADAHRFYERLGFEHDAKYFLRLI